VPWRGNASPTWIQRPLEGPQSHEI